MRSLIFRRTPRGSLRDPAPSKWHYRYQRLMLTPGVRAGLRIGTPLALIAVIASVWLSDEANRAAVTDRYAQIKADIQKRPEFQVTRMRITGADEGIAADINRIVKVDFPVSSFALDLEEMRRLVAALNAVREARVRIADGGTLEVDVTPRIPVALWRSGDNLRLLDKDGVFAGAIASRSERLDLPVIAGAGAFAHIDEALALFRRARPIRDRVRGLARMGERRWDLVLDDNLRVMLPETEPRRALDRVIALHAAHDLLARDVAVVDMRNETRPTVRMTQEAATVMRRVSQTETGE